MTERCEQLRERFSEYLDGELTPEERAALEEHLAACTGCRAELEALRRTVQAVASLPRRTAPEGLAARVAAEIRAETASPRPKAITVLWARALPIAAMLLIVLGITFLVGYEGAVRRSNERQKLAMSLRAGDPAAAAGKPDANEMR
jgi:anti-sigma factor (TIGR02949 family)